MVKKNNYVNNTRVLTASSPSTRIDDRINQYNYYWPFIPIFININFETPGNS